MNLAHLTPREELALLELFMGAFIEELAHVGVRPGVILGAEERAKARILGSVRLAKQDFESRGEYP